MTEIKLNPCPICKKQPRVTKRRYRQIGKSFCTIKCEKVGERSHDLRVTHLTEKIASEMWNKLGSNTDSALLEAAEIVMENYCYRNRCHHDCGICHFGPLKAAVEKAKGGGK